MSSQRSDFTILPSSIQLLPLHPVLEKPCFQNLFKNIKISCCFSGRCLNIFGCEKGRIKHFPKHLQYCIERTASSPKKPKQSLKKLVIDGHRKTREEQTTQKSIPKLTQGERTKGSTNKLL